MSSRDWRSFDPHRADAGRHLDDIDREADAQAAAIRRLRELEFEDERQLPRRRRPAAGRRQQERTIRSVRVPELRAARIARSTT
jgi:hypothetical protein